MANIAENQVENDGGMLDGIAFEEMPDAQMQKTYADAYLIRQYMAQRFDSRLTPDSAEQMRTLLGAVYEQQMQDADGRTSPDYLRASFKRQALQSGWTPEDMPLMDLVFDASKSGSPEMREQGGRLVDGIEGAHFSTIADRNAWLSEISGFAGQVAGQDAERGERLRQGIDEARTRGLCAAEYPTDTAFHQQLRDEGELLENRAVNKDPNKAIRENLQSRAMDYRGQSEAERQRVREKDSYVLGETTAARDEEYQANKAQKDRGIKISNREAAKQVFGSEVYDTIDEARKGTIEERTVKLHHSRGTKQLTQGEQVLEIDIAGSGFGHPRRDHHGIVGGDRDEETLAALLKEEYGELVPGRHHVRAKTTERTLADGTKMEKKRISISGPYTVLGGASNSGGYSIENTRVYARDQIAAYLAPILDDYKKRLAENPNAELKDIHVNVTGHSRGAVAAGETIQFANDWLKSQEQYKDVAKYVKYDLIQRDPVPGFGSYGDHAQNDLSKIPGVNSTVIYAMSQEHADWMFKPQEVSGANRIIFGVMPHSAGLDGADLSQQGVKGDGMAHRRGFYDAASGEFYRGSGLNDLKDGVYFADDKFNLIRVDSYAQIGRLADATFVDGKGLQSDRLAVIKNSAKNWFMAHDLEHSYTSEAQREQALENLARTKEKLLADKGDPRLHAVQEAVTRLDAAEKRAKESGKRDDLALVQQERNKVRDACRSYMGGTPVPTEERLALAGDLLSGVQKERNYMNKGLTPLPGKEKVGEAGRQLARDEARLVKEGMAKGTILETAAESKLLLKRLEATRKRGENSASYSGLHDALERVSRLNGQSSIEESQRAIGDLQKAAKDYDREHKGVFSGWRESGKERREVSRLAGQLAAEKGKELAGHAKGLGGHAGRIDDVVTRRGKTVDALQQKTRAVTFDELKKKNGVRERVPAGEKKPRGTHAEKQVQKDGLKF